MRRAIRLLQAMAVAVLLTAVPIATVSGCSCAMTELDQAVRDASAAFVGRPTAIEPAGMDAFGETVLTTWAVERSRDPIPSATVTVRSYGDNGANCGISFGADERWLVIAHANEGVLETSGCSQNRRLDGSDPEGEAAISAMLTNVTDAAPVEEEAITVPMPLVGLGMAVLLVAGVSALAFRRRPAG